jgi:hypothetical protein
MVPRAGTPSILARGAAALATLLLAAACGSGSSSGTQASAPKSCPETVLETLGHVVRRVYREGVFSERTIVAQQVIEHSLPLREAVERGDAAAVGAAANALVAKGRLTNLIVTAAGRTLANVGGPALAPITGTLAGASGRPIATYVTSVWSQRGFLIESDAIAEGLVAIRVDHRNAGGSTLLPDGRIPASGDITVGGVPYQFYSFGGKVLPGAPARIYLLRRLAAVTPLCGVSEADTTVNTLSRIATLIYDGEAGRRTLKEVQRVQRNPALVAAVAGREPLAATAAIKKLLNQHIVRIRVYGAGPSGPEAQFLADVGGPYVLAPVRAPLRLGGHTMGTAVLSIQDDEGYLRLTGRLAGLRVLMYMGSQLVKNSLGPEPGTVPESGSYTYRGQTFRVFTVHATAFPSGPLTINVLIPIPYS